MCGWGTYLSLNNPGPGERIQPQMTRVSEFSEPLT